MKLLAMPGSKDKDESPALYFHYSAFWEACIVSHVLRGSLSFHGRMVLSWNAAWLHDRRRVLTRLWLLRFSNSVKRLCENNYPSWLSFPTFEQVKWLNLQIKEVWPCFAMAASKLIEVEVEPILLTYCPPGFQVEFAKLFLGNIAPQIEGIKLQILQKGQMVMDLDFRWGGDPSIILAVQTPVGAKFYIQLKDLKFYAIVRILFQLFEDPPCISGVAIALLPEWKMDFNFKLVGGNVTGIPGVREMINDIIKSAITDTLEWPHRLVIPVTESPVDLSDLELKLQGKLILTVIRANSLKNQELIGKSDPYVSAYIRPLFKCKTQVMEDNLDPEWNETFELNVEDKETQSLILQVKDENIGENEVLGVAVYPLSKLNDEETTDLILDLAPSLGRDDKSSTKDCGSLNVSVKYHPFTREEQVSAMEREVVEFEAKRAVAKAVLGSKTMDALVGGAGRLLSDGASIVGSGVGMAGTSLGSAGNFLSKIVSKSVVSK